MKKGSLIVVGTGIHLNHLTAEARDYIEEADKVFYLVVDPITATWILRLSPEAESLQTCYLQGKDRRISYDEMTERIMAAVRGGLRVCAIFYGHPGVLVTSSHQALKQARKEGFAARMCPAVSTEDCLFADLNVDPGKGCQTFEATDFLLHSRIFDPTCSLILYQIGIIGDPTCNPDKAEHPGLTILVDHLLKFYEPTQPIVLYEASQSPRGAPIINQCTLATIDPSLLKVTTTMYVYPLPTRPADPQMREKLGLT